MKLLGKLPSCAVLYSKSNIAVGGERGIFRHGYKLVCGINSQRSDLNYFSTLPHGRRYTNKKFKTEKWKGLHSTDYLYGRLVCEIVMKMSRRSILKVLVNSKWELLEPEDDHVSFILDDAQKRGIPIEYVPVAKLNSISQQRPHQGVCLEVGQLPLHNITVDEIKETFNKFNLYGKLPLWVFLYDVTDPMNVGNIIRSCHFLGVDKILVSPQCAPVTSTTSKASSGAAEITPLNFVSDPNDFVHKLKTAGWEIVGTDSNEQKFAKNLPPVIDLTSVRFMKPTVLVFGNEGFGIPVSVKESCTKLITIEPGKNSKNDLFVACLNVGSAAAVIVHHFLNQRKE